jgi:hypothetical protein
MTDTSAQDLAAAKVHLRTIADNLAQQIEQRKREASLLAMPEVCDTQEDLDRARANVQRAIPIVARMGNLCAAVLTIEGALAMLDALDDARTGG